MRYAIWSLVILILVLAASAVWAQCPNVFQCPMPCPIPQQACSVCSCPCPAAVPAAMGAGPAVGLECLGCPDFDAAYASRMYAQNSVIIAVTQFGMTRASNDNLRDISGEINGYLTSANGKLQAWYGAVACSAASPDCARANAIIAQLAATPANCFDGVYASTLSQLLQQSNAADSIAATKAVTAPMRQQAQFLSGKEADWTMRLNRWVSDHGATTR